MWSLFSWPVLLLAAVFQSTRAEMVAMTGRGARETWISWERTRIRENTVLARAVQSELGAEKKSPDEHVDAFYPVGITKDTAGALARCLRHDADHDLAPVFKRMQSTLGRHAAMDCARGARHFYCEALLDVLEPWPFQPPSVCKNEPAYAAEMRLEVERDVPLCYIIFIMGEVAAVQQFLRHRGKNDCAVIHVDIKWPEAYDAMMSWAANETCVRIESRWAIIRPSYSAGAALLDMYEVAVTLAVWEVALFLSGSHFWTRPRSELARYLFYHRVNMVAADDGDEGEQIDYRQAVAPHYELQYECANHTWRVTRDEEHSTVLLPRLGHPNLTASFGQPFSTLRRDFVEWIVRSRRVRGSPAWVVLRHTMRTFGCVEQMISTLLLNSPWCHNANFRHDLTFALTSSADQELQWNSSSEGLESNALSAGILDESDLERMRVARWHSWSAYQVVHGTDRPPPPLATPIAVLRVTSQRERAAMKCNKCFEALSLYNCTDASTVFQAFARKVGPSLRARLEAEDVSDTADVWVPFEWPLAQRVWDLWVSTNCPSKSGVSSLEVHRHLCDLRDDSTPCPLELRIQQLSCEDAPVLRLRERIAVGYGRIYAMQVGAGWSYSDQVLAMPSMGPSSTADLAVLFFLTVRRRWDMLSAGLVRIVLINPAGGATVHRAVGDICVLPKRGFAQFSNVTFADGEWKVLIEKLPSREALTAPVVSDRILAQRPFLLYSDSKRVTKQAILKYFDVDFLTHSDLQNTANL